MASTLEREFLFCDKVQNDLILGALYELKQSSTFCDVIMKVCGQEIFAHSNVLAAASPYLSSFLSQDLPRQFSQRSPQVIEIQIDGSDPSFLYVEAVTAVVDFIYTGKILMKQSSVSQVYEIGRIMQMDSIVRFCTEFLEDKPKLTDSSEGAIENTGARSGEPTKKDCGTLTDIWDAAGKMDDILARHVPAPSYRSRVSGKTGDPSFHAKIKAKQLVSVSCQIYPHLLPELAKDNANMQDQATSTDSRYFETLRNITQSGHRTRKRKTRGHRFTYHFIHSDHNNVVMSSGVGDVNEQETINVAKDVEMHNPGDSTDSAEANEQVSICDNEDAEERKIVNMCNSDSVNNNSICTESSTKKAAPSQEKANRKVSGDVISKGSPRRSSRRFKPTTRFQEFHELQELHGLQLKRMKEEVTEAATGSVGSPVLLIAPTEDGIMKTDNGTENTKEERMEQEEAAVRLLSLADEIVQKQNPQDVVDGGELVEQDTDNEDEQSALKTEGTFQKRTMKRTVGNLIQIGPGKYQCETCSFHTNKVRQMSAHIKLHKLENNTCYYCEQKFDSKETLADHMGQHKGPVPFFCHICRMRFKSRTLLNMHLPKHSDSKPFICHVCCMGFKWKHALKSHMITHTNKKEHLCDICGYATAHKSQLKAHRKIHSGDMLKCYYPNCNFLATKSQNLKYHLLTHTKEKPHKCDTCGQSFSLVKNLRRHHLLHSTEKKLSCTHCIFSSTRLDKLKEHMLKIHGIGTPPERRVRVTDLVYGQANLIAQGAKDDSAKEKDQGFVKVELLEQTVATSGVGIKQEEMSISQMTQLTQELSAQGNAGERTLVEIIQENGQPVQILRNQSILITHPADQEGNRILHHVEGTVQDLSEIVQIASTANSQTLVLSEPADSVVTSVGQDSGSLGLMTGHDVVTMESGADGLVNTQIVTAVPGYLQIQGLDSEEVTYAEMVEVPMEQAPGLVQQVDDVQIE